MSYFKIFVSPHKIQSLPSPCSSQPQKILFARFVQKGCVPQILAVPVQSCAPTSPWPGTPIIQVSRGLSMHKYIQKHNHKTELSVMSQDAGSKSFSASLLSESVPKLRFHSTHPQSKLHRSRFTFHHTTYLQTIQLSLHPSHYLQRPISYKIQ
jgi:hypothetical protein